MPGFIVDGRDNEGGRSPGYYDGDRIERGREIEEGRRGRRLRDGRDNEGGRSPGYYDGDRIERGREIEEGRRGRRLRDGRDKEGAGAREIATGTA
jgi:hypothetical protein